MSSLEDSIEVAHPEQPHCATVLLLDTSSSMQAGNKIGQLNDGLRLFKDEVAGDELARKRVDLAVVTFGGTVAVQHDFSAIDEFEPPTLVASGDTPMGEAILRATEMIEERKREYDDRGIDYYRPWIFMITDGEPTDMGPGDAQWTKAVGAVHEGEAGKKFMFFAVGVEPADMDTLAQIAPPNRGPVQLRPGRFKEMFEWLSRSQARVSASTVGDQVDLEDPTGPNGWATVSTD